MTTAMKQCPRCHVARMDFYSKVCVRCRSETLGVALWAPEDVAFLRANYPDHGAAWVSERLAGKTPRQVRDKANVLKIPLTKEARRRIVHDRAAAHMREDNPSRHPGAAERMRIVSSRPEHIARLRQQTAERQRDKPSKLELRACAILDDFGVAYEPQVMLKKLFIVDIRIGRLIIELDGDYWHGHPRYGHLTERQARQRKRDASRNAYLTACGYKVVRIWESDMNAATLRRVLDENAVFSGQQPPGGDPTPICEKRMARRARDAQQARFDFD